MAVAAPKRRSAAAPAPAPSRTSPPKRRKAAAPATAPARRAPSRPSAPKRRKATAAPATAPKRRKPKAAVAAPARRAPQRARVQTKPKRAATQPRLALVVGRTAATVRDLPDSSLIVRMTRGRLWIGVLGVLLVGIVALNVVTLSFAASLGRIDEQVTALEKENSMLKSRQSLKSGLGRIHLEGKEMGLVDPISADPIVIEPGPNDAAVAAERLASAGG